MDKLEKRLCRRSFKADTRKLGLGLVLYLIIEYAAVIAYTFIARFTFLKSATDAEFDVFLENSGTSMIIATIIGTLFMFLFFLPRKTHHQIFIKNKKMTLGWFAVLLCLFMGVQLIIEPLFAGFEALLNLMGFSAMSSMEAATSTGEDTLSMFIYGGIVAPIVEELIYRGFAMRVLSKHGKTFAILVSSILFGVMHGNLPQAMFATLTGIVLGYVAMEYSIIWSIILHALNNMVFGDLLTRALNNTSELTSNIIWYTLISVMFVIGLVAIIIKRKQILAYVKENKWNKPYMRWTFTTVLMLLFVLVNIILGVTMLEAI